MRIAIDTGGTFTDCVYLKQGELAVLKVLSTPDDPAKSLLAAIEQILADSGTGPVREHHETEPTAKHSCLEVRHGTTIGTNALLERKGARVAFIATEGFEDTIAIGRQARQHLYDWLASPAPCIVPPELRFGVRERVSAEGTILVEPSAEELSELAEKIRRSGAESVAVSLLFSFANPTTEQRIADAILQTSGIAGTGGLSTPVSISHEILPEFREYERAATVVVNAYLAPKVGSYLRRLASEVEREHSGSLYVMQSSGGIVGGALAAREPVRTVLSGPAGGVIGAYRVSELAGFGKIIGFDMGGTSTDVSLVDSGGPRTTNEARVSEIPVAIPMLDIHTVGAGGGSLAWFDDGGILHVGPASAGADPGPICYGRGEQPTVTDANLVLGRLDVQLALAGAVKLDAERTRNFMEKCRGSIPSVEQFAAGILKLAEAEMEKAIRLISVERGHDPREFILVAFGGAGPLHACALARALQIPRVLVPAMPGALSALGILMSDIVRDYSRTVMLRIEAPRAEDVTHGYGTDRGDSAPGSTSQANFAAMLEPSFTEVETKARNEFSREGLQGVSTRSVDLRYAGQGYELNIPFGPAMLHAFHCAHRKRYGHADESRTVEVVNVRVRMIAASTSVEFPRRERGGSECSSAVLKRKKVMFDGEWLDTPVFQRDLLSPGNQFMGPAIVHEYSATAVVPAQCSVEVDEHSNLVITV